MKNNEDKLDHFHSLVLKQWKILKTPTHSIEAPNQRNYSQGSISVGCFSGERRIPIEKSVNSDLGHVAFGKIYCHVWPVLINHPSCHVYVWV